MSSDDSDEDVVPVRLPKPKYTESSSEEDEDHEEAQRGSFLDEMRARAQIVARLSAADFQLSVPNRGNFAASSSAPAPALSQMSMSMSSASLPVTRTIETGIAERTVDRLLRPWTASNFHTMFDSSTVGEILKSKHGRSLLKDWANKNRALLGIPFLAPQESGSRTPSPEEYERVMKSVTLDNLSELVEVIKAIKTDLEDSGEDSSAIDQDIETLSNIEEKLRALSENAHLPADVSLLENQAALKQVFNAQQRSGMLSARQAQKIREKITHSLGEVEQTLQKTRTQIDQCCRDVVLRYGELVACAVMYKETKWRKLRRTLKIVLNRLTESLADLAYRRRCFEWFCMLKLKIIGANNKVSASRRGLLGKTFHSVAFWRSDDIKESIVGEVPSFASIRDLLDTSSSISSYMQDLTSRFISSEHASVYTGVVDLFKRSKINTTNQTKYSVEVMRLLRAMGSNGTSRDVVLTRTTLVHVESNKESNELFVLWDALGDMASSSVAGTAMPSNRRAPFYHDRLFWTLMTVSVISVTALVYGADVINIIVPKAADVTHHTIDAMEKLQTQGLLAGLASKVVDGVVVLGASAMGAREAAVNWAANAGTAIKNYLNPAELIATVTENGVNATLGVAGTIAAYCAGSKTLPQLWQTTCDSTTKCTSICAKCIPSICKNRDGNGVEIEDELDEVGRRFESVLDVRTGHMSSVAAAEHFANRYRRNQSVRALYSLEQEIPNLARSAYDDEGVDEDSEEDVAEEEYEEGTNRDIMECLLDFLEELDRRFL